MTKRPPTRSATSRHVQTLFHVGTVGGLTDGQLLERFTNCKGGTAELAFAALVERHGPMVLRVCRAVLRDHHDAQDAFQATFLILVQRAGSLWVRDSIGPWLNRVAYRTARCARSATARRREHEQKAAERAGESEARASQGDLGEAIIEEVSRLPERYRTAIVLCLMEGLTHEQAAHRLGWPVGTVQSRLARGRERLRNRLVRRGVATAVGTIFMDVAGVPPALARSTTSAAMGSVAGMAGTAPVAATIVLLSKRVLRTMFLTKIATFCAGTLILASAIVTGAFAYQGVGAATSDPAVQQGPDRQPDEPAKSSQATAAAPPGQAPPTSSQATAAAPPGQAPPTAAAPPGQARATAKEEAGQLNRYGTEVITLALAAMKQSEAGDNQALDTLLDLEDTVKEWSSAVMSTMSVNEAKRREAAHSQRQFEKHQRERPHQERRRGAGNGVGVLNRKAVEPPQPQGGGPSTDQEQRIRAVERKLDQILKTMEGSRNQAPQRQ